MTDTQAQTQTQTQTHKSTPNKQPQLPSISAHVRNLLGTAAPCTSVNTAVAGRLGAWRTCATAAARTAAMACRCALSSPNALCVASRPPVSMCSVTGQPGCGGTDNGPSLKPNSTAASANA